MKRIVLLGSDEKLGRKLTNTISTKGFSVKKTNNISKLGQLLKRLRPEYLLCSGTIKVDSEGNYYLEP